MIKYFRSQSEFHKWLEKNHAVETELLVGFYKVDSGRGGITYKEALDEALCYGWIDGVRRRVDDASYTIRFTPRKPKSNWSEVNVKRVAELTADGLMQPPGMAAFEARDESKTRQYSYEARSRGLSEEYESRLKANPRAWKFFDAQPPYYKKTAAWWVMSAKKEETRQRRLEALIADSEAGQRLAAATPGSKE